MFPCKLKRGKRLELAEYEAHLAYASWCFQNLEFCSSFPHRIVFSGDCEFYVSGEWDKQKVQTWGAKNPHEDCDMSEKSKKVPAWSALSDNESYRTLIFDDAIVDGNIYLCLMSQ